MAHSIHDFPPLPETESWTFVREDDEETFDDGSRLIVKPEDEEWVNCEVEVKAPYAKIAAVVLEQGDQKVPEALPALVSDEEDVTSDVVIVPNAEEPVALNDKTPEDEKPQYDEQPDDSEKVVDHDCCHECDYDSYDDRDHGSDSNEEDDAQVDSLTTISEQLVEMHKSPHRTKYENDNRQKRRDRRLQRDLKLNNYATAIEIKSPQEDGRIRPNLHPKQVEHEMQKEWKKMMTGHRRMTKADGRRKKAVRHDLSV